MFNQRGDFILYIIVSIVVVLIGAILFYLYLGNDSDNNYLDQLKDSNFIGEFKSKPITNQILDKETYPNSYKINAKLELDIKLELSDKNISIDGNPEIIFSERLLTITNPTLTNFQGYIDNSGIFGGIKNVFNDSTSLELNSYISTNFININSVLIEDLYLDLEKANINGQIIVQDREFSLKKGYLKIKGFLGTAKIIPDNDIIHIQLDGNIGYIKIIDNSLETVLK